MVTIDSLGHRGDGVFTVGSESGYVPFTLPGERVLVERNGERATLLEIIEPSPDRVAPVCRHFGVCGGCSLQMMPLAETRRFKRDLVAAALAREGLDADIADTIGVDPACRRRAVFTAMRVDRRVLLGFNERLSNRLVDIAECPVLVGKLADRLPAIRELLGPLIGGRSPARVTMLLTSAGIDLNIDGVRLPDPAAITKLVGLAQAASVARLSVERVTVLTLAEPSIDLSGVRVVPPPGAFLQASAKAEAILSRLVLDHLEGARRAADLFAGVGTFALALARRAPVTAVENDQPALEALAEAAHGAAGVKRIETERRDLFAYPLSPQELKVFDGAVFDPPRAGAKAQAVSLAASSVPRVAAVSCNPASFARDARLLVDGGYRLERVVPIDQFVYSVETEVVGLFTRPAR